jgi:hypothetical protein
MLFSCVGSLRGADSQTRRAAGVRYARQVRKTAAEGRAALLVRA